MFRNHAGGANFGCVSVCLWYIIIKTNSGRQRTTSNESGVGKVVVSENRHKRYKQGRYMESKRFPSIGQYPVEGPETARLTLAAEILNRVSLMVENRIVMPVSGSDASGDDIRKMFGS